jgi:tetratricopeptide (TPR) repeat protein
LKFQEDVQTPVHELHSLGLVETQMVSGGPFGGDLFSLTPLGDRVLRLLNDPLFLRQAPADSNIRRLEAELLNKLGDVAKEKGNLDQAFDFYQQALSSYRKLLSV